MGYAIFDQASSPREEWETPEAVKEEVKSLEKKFILEPSETGAEEILGKVKE